MKDPYILDNGTLINLLGIINYDELNQAERDISYVKLLDVEKVFTKKFDINLLRQIHGYIFEDIFEWAGKFRTVNIYKEEVVIPGLSLNYTYPENIEKELNRNLEDLNSCSWENKNINEITTQFTKHLTKIWKVHPFRDGNTRTTLTFANIFAKQHGFEMDMSTILDNLGRVVDPNTGKVLRYSIRDKFVLAALDEKDYPEPQHLEKIIKLAISNGINKKINSLNEIMEK